MNVTSLTVKDRENPAKIHGFVDPLASNGISVTYFRDSPRANKFDSSNMNALVKLSDG